MKYQRNTLEPAKNINQEGSLKSIEIKERKFVYRVAGSVDLSF